MLKKWSFDEWLILLVSASIFLPYYICATSVTLVVIYLIAKKRMPEIIRQIPKSKYVIFFSILSAAISLCYQNMIGFFCSLGILILFLYLFFFRTTITKPLFDLILQLFLILSICNVIYAWFEYVQICTRLGLNPLDFIVKNRPENRVHTVFFNANYYAMVIEFCVLICVYKMIHLKNKVQFIYYMAVILVNWFALYLTGCRTAWIPFIMSVPFMFALSQSYIYLGLSLTGAGLAGGILFFVPALFQRITLAKDFGKRARIWKAALEGIKAHPMFGNGPLTYFQIYKLYDGHPTQHAHNLGLDLILSHGIIGTVLLGIYIFSNIKEAYLLYKNKMDVRLACLIAGLLITVLIHGMLDYTIFWIQTSLIFFTILSSTSMYYRKKST